TGTTGVRSGRFARFRFASAFTRICARQLGKTVGLSLATLNVDRSDIVISVDTPQQLSLSVSLSDDATFENFYAPPTSHNRQVVAALRDQLDDGVDSTFLFLWGSAGSGCSHLLQASCHRAQAQGLTIQYLPLQELVNSAPADLLAGLEALDFIALDDLHAVAGDPAWELA